MIKYHLRLLYGSCTQMRYQSVLGLHYESLPWNKQTPSLVSQLVTKIKVMIMSRIIFHINIIRTYPLSSNVFLTLKDLASVFKTSKAETRPGAIKDEDQITVIGLMWHLSENTNSVQGHLD